MKATSGGSAGLIKCLDMTVAQLTRQSLPNISGRWFRTSHCPFENYGLRGYYVLK